MNKQIWIYDVETLSNVFTYSAVNRDSDEIVKFVIWKNRNELPQLLEHLDSCAGQIGFNNMAFDANIIELILRHRSKFLTFNGDRIAKAIYKEAQRVISLEWSNIWNPSIPQLDIYKIHHFDNKAKMCSLKKLEIAMGFDNVQDMPYHHSEEITTDQQIEEILAYNINDIKATKEFYGHTKEKIELRKGLLQRYDLPCLNYSDSKIGEELVLKLYCEATGKNINIVKKGRTSRSIFKFNECIPSYINFKTSAFNNFLEDLKKEEVNELKNSFNKQVYFHGAEFFFGTGGIHQSLKEGVYESTDSHMIIDADVGSLYPSLAVKNDIYPEHLGKSFCAVYETVLNERMKAKAAKEMIMADGFKLALNSVYGKSNSQYSPFFDGLYTLKTTLAGQLSLCMLIEMLVLGIPDVVIIQTNTDGITVKIDRKDKRKYWEICQEWEAITKLNLEYATYEKIIMRDVNNYLAVSVDKKTGEEKVKRKGVFKLHSEMKQHGEWHKAFNQGIVPIAVSDYFLKDIPVSETIKNHTDIFDFCKTFSVKGKFICETYELDELGNEINIKEGQKTNRYYLSTNGVKFRKRGEPLKPKMMKLDYFYNNQAHRAAYRQEFLPYNNEKLFDSIQGYITAQSNTLLENGEINDRLEIKAVIRCNPTDYRILSANYQILNNIFQVSSIELIRDEEFSITCEKDWRLIDIEAGESLVTIFNKSIVLPIEEYNIDYDYYIEECNKIIDTITGKKERVLKEKKEEKERERMQKDEQNYIQFCVNKIPTTRQFQQYSRPWLLEKYGMPKEIKESKLKIKEENPNQQALAFAE